MRRAFTLIELLIVVVILGILAAVALPTLTDSQRSTRREVFSSNLRDLVQAVTLYHSEFGTLPTQAPGDRIPAALWEGVGRSDHFDKHTPIGGYWHIGQLDNKWGVGVWWQTEADGVSTRAAAMEVDGQIDDGNPNAGKFRDSPDNQYYWMIE